MQGKSSKVAVLVSITALFGFAVLLLSSSPQREFVASTSGAGFIGSDAGYNGGSTYLAPPKSVEPEPDLSGSVNGLLVDEGEIPLRGIEVELMPLEKTGDARWYATITDWTDGNGKYEFPRVDPGEYVLAVQKRGAPDGRHPFIGTYYPGVDEETDAERIYVQTGVPLELHTLKLQRIETVNLKISVEFEDGTRPAWSNLLFHNPTFPNQGVIGDEAPGIEDGRGEFVLPVGFEYYARAKVDCDAGPRIETRESRPVQTLHIKNGHIPSEVKFVIPGPACALWSPK